MPFLDHEMDLFYKTCLFLYIPKMKFLISVRQTSKYQIYLTTFIIVRKVLQSCQCYAGLAHLRSMHAWEMFRECAVSVSLRTSGHASAGWATSPLPSTRFVKGVIVPSWQSFGHLMDSPRPIPVASPSVARRAAGSSSISNADSTDVDKSTDRVAQKR